MLDRCRIRWGYVEAVTGDLVTVRNRLLGFDGSRLVLGPEEVEVARRSLHGVGPAPPVTVGDMVSLHWDWVCDRLTPAGAEALVTVRRRPSSSWPTATWPPSGAQGRLRGGTPRRVARRAE